MKKIMRKIGVMLSLVLALTLVMGMTVSADGADTSVFDFGQMLMSVKAGESATISLYAKNSYSWYLVGNNSKKTYAVCSGNKGYGNCTFYVGEDEKPGSTLTFWFYIDGTDQHDDVQIRVLPAAGKTTAAATVTGAVAPVSVAFNNGKAGILSALSSNTIGYMTDTAGTPLAAFSVSTGKGTKLLPMQILTPVAVNGVTYLSVNTAVNATNINIGANDKAMMQNYGIAGLYLNQQYIAWPQ